MSITSEKLAIERPQAKDVLWPRLLVITGFAPGNEHVGAILCRQILEQMPRQMARVVAIMPRGQELGESTWVDLARTRRFEYAYRPLPGIAGEAAAWLGYGIFFSRHLKRLADDCVRQGTEHRSTAVLAVMECPTVIFLAERVARRLGAPLYCFVMDSPRLQARYYGYDCWATRRLLRTFDRALTYAERLAVAGESMKEVYRQHYGKTGTILRQGLPYTPSSDDSIQGCGSDSTVLRIGLAGTLSACDTFYALLEELQRRQWRLAGRKVILRFVGAQLKMVPPGPIHIEYLGWRPVPEMIRLMSECDFLYLPQPFSEAQRECAELSFPNKICTYVPGRRPIALHAPSHASLTVFFQRYPCGPQSTESDARHLLDQMEDAVVEPDVYGNYVSAVDAAFEEELNLQRLQERVARFLRARQ